MPDLKYSGLAIFCPTSDLRLPTSNMRRGGLPRPPACWDPSPRGDV